MDIKIKNLTKIVKNKTLIDDMSINIPSGTILGIIGPNGAGKTTLIRLLLNIYEKTSGEILVDNVPVESEKYLKKKQSISFILDNLGLFKDLNTWNNLEFFDRIYFKNSTKEERSKRIEEALKSVNLYDKRKDKIYFFSRGMRQRLAIARAFLIKPKLMILDEPTRGLDIDGIYFLRDKIKELNETGCTILITSHNLDELQKICDKYCFIDSGKIIKEGSFLDFADYVSEKVYKLEIKNYYDSIYNKLIVDSDIEIVYEDRKYIYVYLKTKSNKYIFDNDNIGTIECSADDINLEIIYKVIKIKEQLV